MYRSNLNLALFNAYFYDLLQKGLLEETNADRNATYVTSEQGRTLLIALKKAEELFSEVPTQPIFVLR
jgi:predicted transcriptional regulator